MQSGRRLVVVRHAKSAWPAGVLDAERPLGPRGRRDAPVMGRRIREAIGGVDVVVVSPTERTGQTWALMNGPLGHSGPVVTDPRIYHAWGAQMVQVVRELPDEARTAMVLGHEPGVSELVLTLSEGTGHALRRQVADKFPTCAIAVLRTQRDWADLGPGSAELELFTTPKD